MSDDMSKGMDGGVFTEEESEEIVCLQYLKNEHVNGVTFLLLNCIKEDNRKIYNGRKR